MQAHTSSPNSIRFIIAGPVLGSVRALEENCFFAENEPALCNEECGIWGRFFAAKIFSNFTVCIDGQ